jgi:hypothetical protein
MRMKARLLGRPRVLTGVTNAGKSAGGQDTRGGP